MLLLVSVVMPVMAALVVSSTVRVRAGRARRVTVGLWRDGRGLEDPRGVWEAIRSLYVLLRLVVSWLVELSGLPISVSL